MGKRHTPAEASSTKFEGNSKKSTSDDFAEKWFERVLLYAPMAAAKNKVSMAPVAMICVALAMALLEDGTPSKQACVEYMQRLYWHCQLM